MDTAMSLRGWRVPTDHAPPHRHTTEGDHIGSFQDPFTSCEEKLYDFKDPF